MFIVCIIYNSYVTLQTFKMANAIQYFRVKRFEKSQTIKNVTTFKIYIRKNKIKGNLSGNQILYIS